MPRLTARGPRSALAPASFAFAACALAACDDRAPPLTVTAPAALRAALAGVPELSATVEVVEKGGTAGAPIPLARGDDQVSFSGFVGVAPGDYTAEIAFAGTSSLGVRLFLGRLSSDAFTVVRGQAATPVFSRPLDPLGRPSDHGDDDRDGLGDLDELLWHTDRARADSDRDGVPDGVDCAPTDVHDAAHVAVGASLDDCDGDQERRADLPYGEPGTDCDDRDPAVNRRAVDVCDDAVDQDCNPATCPADVGTGPVIALIAPVDGETIGCSRGVVARVSGQASVVTVRLVRLSGAMPPEEVESLLMQPTGPALYDSGSLEERLRTWLEDGPQRFLIRATDDAGKTTELPLSVNYALGPPVAALNPALIGERSQPFDVTVTAHGRAPIKRIRLMITPADASSGDRAGEVELGHGDDTSTVTVRVDPSQFPGASYAIYPLVEDAIGNRLLPEATVHVDGRPNEAVFGCVFDSGQFVPVARMTKPVNTAGFEAAKMKTHLAEAVAIAQSRDPLAVPASIAGKGIQADGLIRLNVPGDAHGDRSWSYTFINTAAMRTIVVSWKDIGATAMNPVVEVTAPDPFQFSLKPMVADPTTFADSDAAVSAFQTDAACPALHGYGDTEWIRYESDQPFHAFDIVRIDVDPNIFWKAAAAMPSMEIFTCN